MDPRETSLPPGPDANATPPEDARPSEDALDILAGSRARAGIIALLFGDDPRARHQREIARETGAPLRTVQRELERLVVAGLVVRGKAVGTTYRRTDQIESYKRPYFADRSHPIHAELRAIAMKVRGAAARIREGLPDRARLAWISGKSALGHARPQDAVELVVIGHPKKLIERTLEQVGAQLGRQVRTTVIYQDEWVARLDKRELTVMRLRRGPKLWLRGDGLALFEMEKRQREGKQLIQQVLASGLDLTDDWDEDLDPSESGRPWP
jgi:DNA-binding Lrp family transcriptional regulator